MIKVNLLPERVRTAAAMQRNILLGAVLLMVAAAGVGANYFQKRTALKAVQQRIERVRAEMDSPELKKVVQAVGEFTVQRQSLEAQQAVVNALREKQVALIRLLDIMPDVLPPRLWLTDLAAVLEKGKFKVTIRGTASSPEEVAQFFANLQNRGTFSTVSLDSPPAPGAQMGATVVNFSISFLFEG